MDKNNSLAMLITGIAGVIIGAIGMLATRTHLTTTNTQSLVNIQQTTARRTDTKAADFRTTFHAQHVTLARSMISTGFSVWDKRADAAAAASATDTLTKDMAATTGQIYGAQAQKDWHDIWSSQTRFLMDYLQAVRDGDQAGRQNNIAYMSGFVQTMVNEVNSLKIPVNQSTFKGSLQQTVAVMKQAVDAYGQGKYADAYTAEHQAQTVLGQVADQLTTAIVQQHPEKF